MAKTSKGAEFLARERDRMGPTFTGSSARLFAERGNPWRTERENDRDYPTRRSQPAEKPLKPHEIAALKIRARVRRNLGLPEAHAPEPRKAVVVDVEFDSYFAEKAQPKPEFVDAPPIEDGTSLQARVSKIHRDLVAKQHARKTAKQTKTVNVRDNVGKPVEVRGGFYSFGKITRPIAEQTHYEPRPFDVPVPKQEKIKPTPYQPPEYFSKERRLKDEISRLAAEALEIKREAAEAVREELAKQRVSK